MSDEVYGEKTTAIPERNIYEERLRDQFAMAAMAGLLAHPEICVGGIVKSSYQYADAMLEERKRRNRPL